MGALILSSLLEDLVVSKIPWAPSEEAWTLMLHPKKGNWENPKVGNSKFEGAGTSKKAQPSNSWGVARWLAVPSSRI